MSAPRTSAKIRGRRRIRQATFTLVGTGVALTAGAVVLIEQPAASVDAGTGTDSSTTGSTASSETGGDAQVQVDLGSSDAHGQSAGS